jgi:hypothetical protein
MADLDKPVQEHLEIEHSRGSVLVFIALGAFLAGMALGESVCERSHGPSRIKWPAEVARPRTLEP